MDSINRRKFLQASTSAATLLVTEHILAACSTPLPSQTPDPIPTQDQAAPKPVEQSPSPNPQKWPDLAIARNGDPEVMTRRAIAALGGMERFVPKGSRVVVKPNICVAYHSYEYAATTNPWVVVAIVKMALEAGARSVEVMDSPFGGTPEQAYQISGIGDLVKAAGGEMVVMKNMQFQEHEIPGAKNLKTTSINDLIYNADVLINVPVAKDHSLANLTLGMKNLMGAIQDPGRLHMDLSECLPDLNMILKPQLTIIDAVRILMANGPTGGDLNDVKQTNTVIASPDIVAADSYAAGLFEMQPSELGYLVEGSRRGIGRMDLENLKIEEINAG